MREAAEVEPITAETSEVSSTRLGNSLCCGVASRLTRRPWSRFNLLPLKTRPKVRAHDLHLLCRAVLSMRVRWDEEPPLTLSEARTTSRSGNHLVTLFFASLRPLGLCRLFWPHDFSPTAA